jgi:hypothetical protein
VRLNVLRNLYYDLKPYLPHPVRMAFRKRLAQRILKRNSNVWPINPACAAKPPGWVGWPGNKQFALVLTHDVESRKGVDQSEALLALESDLGFRSSFNFIPEGSYRVDEALIHRIKAEGFEVGVHDLHHNGKLYRNKKKFDAAVPRINKYLREWNAVGFRSGFMHRNLDWLHALDIEYDMSTFDTDPFEPQPDGANTIFPFWVPDRHHDGLSNTICRKNSSCGYAELPYTLPQDSTLFIILGEPNIATWMEKVEWIAGNGGLVLLNTHPDYICFDTRNSPRSCAMYSSSLYLEFLNEIKAKYADAYWHALPREVANFTRTKLS